MLNPRRVLTRAQLLDHVWNYDFGGDGRVLETYISYLRKKLDAHGPSLIRTVRGVGYALQAPRELMSSLRARVLASVLVLAAVGMVALGAVTYAEQHSFLLGARRPAGCAAGPAVSQALDSTGYGDRSTAQGPAAREPSEGGRRHGSAGGRTTAAAESQRCRPAPTVSVARARRRDRSRLLSFGQPRRRRRRSRAASPLGKCHDRRPVSSAARATASMRSHDPEDTGLTVVAVPLREVDQTLNRLLLVEALVIAGVLLALGAAAFFVVSSACARSTALR